MPIRLTCLQVGGDGLFQEVTDGLLALRREGGPRATLALGLRLAQIPAGSTDGNFAFLARCLTIKPVWPRYLRYQAKTHRLG